MARANAAVPGISRGTVYATLAELAELGLLGSVGNPEPVRYETNLKPHDHFRCRLCLRLLDVELGGQELRRRPLDGYTVELLSVRAEGICNDCQSFERGVIAGARGTQDTRSLSDELLDTLSCARIDSPIGDLALAASSAGVVRVAFSDQADFEALQKRARSRRGSAPGRALAKHLGATLTGYFTGDRTPPAEVVDWQLTSDQQAAALRLVQEIPYGTSRSYHLLTTELDAYDCGHLLGSNPLALMIPCHRVTRGTERLRAYVGGIERLSVLTTLEAGSP